MGKGVVRATSCDDALARYDDNRNGMITCKEARGTSPLSSCIGDLPLSVPIFAPTALSGEPERAGVVPSAIKSPCSGHPVADSAP